MPNTNANIDVRIQAQNFDLAQECNALRQYNSQNTGALVNFVGYCRDEDGRLEALELDHYPGMAEKEITAICEKATERWPLFAVSAIHRYGRIAPSEEIVFVGVTSRHRKAAFEAAEFIMDFLKSRAPFWKKEHLADVDNHDNTSHTSANPETTGISGGWVDAREADDEALKRWDQMTSKGD